MTDPRALVAARNNADWYAMMFDIHGLRYRRSAHAFLALDPPPPYHGWMVTLDPEAAPAHLDVISGHRCRPGFGLKDSFGCLELSDAGLVELFRADWIWAAQVPRVDTTGWVRIASPEALQRWEAAWKAGGSPMDGVQFPAALLGRSDVAVFGRSAGAGFDAGVVANLSADSVGLSNAFGDDAFPAAATLCAGFGAGRPVVGYERGDALAAALRAGFQATGPLRVWIAPS
jgi:hypothetical protein